LNWASVKGSQGLYEASEGGEEEGKLLEKARKGVKGLIEGSPPMPLRPKLKRNQGKQGCQKSRKPRNPEKL
jgi:hypothetical protein